MSSFKCISVLAFLVVALCAVYVAEAGPFDMLVSHFEKHRESRCPAPGEERELPGKITIKTLNFPKQPCKDFCASQGLESMEGNELAVLGPKVICCCKPIDAE